MISACELILTGSAALYPRAWLQAARQGIDSAGLVRSGRGALPRSHLLHEKHDRRTQEADDCQIAEVIHIRICGRLLIQTLLYQAIAAEVRDDGAGGGRHRPSQIVQRLIDNLPLRDVSGQFRSMDLLMASNQCTDD